ncbi:terpene cyclase, partial [Penicillium robsamsonii]|uniref:terpene cyclase n=1 Tax=Penicillium robsamsonii TaxID=1792511 RepID=UPI002547A7DB
RASFEAFNGLCLGSVRTDGHWCRELKSNVTITAEYIFLRYVFELDLKADREARRINHDRSLLVPRIKIAQGDIIGLCTQWFLERQETTGDWAGIFPPMHGRCPVRLGIQALENFAWEDEKDKMIQAYVSPVWDTALTSIELCDAKSSDRQVCSQALAWRVYRPHLDLWGFSIEYNNIFYPDVDYTAAVILAQIEHDVGSDMAQGRILEAFRLIVQCATKKSRATSLFPALHASCTRGICYIPSTQESSGAWFGRWGCNYIYGTNHALCGQEYFVNKDKRVRGLVQPALRWLKLKQNVDGGWGETLLSYRSPEKGQGKPTASQSAWALRVLLAHLHPTDIAVEHGICWLVSSQRLEKGIGSSWPEAVYTGTGFPNQFYLGYDYHRHYFPMMALGRHLQAVI